MNSVNINVESQNTKAEQGLHQKAKFQTQKQAFDITYIKFDHAQQSMNEDILNNFVEAVTNNYKQNPRPVSIVDICCGYGLQTIKIRERLLKNGVEIGKMVGYDLSKDMIEYAQRNNTFPQVSFVVKNIQTQFNDVQEYDAAICLFGIHWMNDMDKAIAAMHRSLKKGGLFASQTTIQVKDLYDLRQNFMLYSRWSSAFNEESKILHAFAFDKEVYLNLLTKYFTTVHEEHRAIKFDFNRNDYIIFLQSWLQQVRHLTNQVSHELKKEAIGRAYLQDFVDSIDKNLDGNIIIRENGSITYYQHVFDFDGIKK